LPGLPAPVLAGGDEQGSLVVTWNPVVLATGYAVELRPAGVQAQWSAVDVSSGQLGGDASSRFARECSSCRVSGLPSNVVFEARVTYFTSCGCRADSSDASDWCIACPAAVPARNFSNAGAQRLLQVGSNLGSTYTGLACANPKGVWFNSPVVQHPIMPNPEAWAGLWHTPAAAPAVSMPSLGLPAGDYQQMQPYVQSPGWRCIHGMVNPPPPTPELRLADDAGFAILVQWPSVNHATAYVVELRESGSQRVERFIRSVPAQAMGSLVELRIGGLRPFGMPGQYYIAQVRCVSACACESEPSPPGWSQPLGSTVPVITATSQPQMQPQQQQQQPQLQPQFQQLMPQQQQPQQPHQPQQQQQPMATHPVSQFGTKPSNAGATENDTHAHNKLGFHPQPRAAPSRSSPGDEQKSLPTLLSPSSRVPPVPPPEGPAPHALKQEVIPEVAGMEEDCIILD